MLVSELFEKEESLVDLIAELDSLKRKMKQPGAGDPLEFSYKFNNILRLISSTYGDKILNSIKQRYDSNSDFSISKPRAGIPPKSAEEKKPVDNSVSFSKIAPFQDKIAKLKVRLMKKNLQSDILKDLNMMLIDEYKRAKEHLNSTEYEILDKNITDYFVKHIPLPDYSSRK